MGELGRGKGQAATFIGDLDEDPIGRKITTMFDLARAAAVRDPDEVAAAQLARAGFPLSRSREQAG